MYNLTDIRDVHLELTSKCQARCPMCPRRINGGKMNPLVTLDEIDLDTFKQWFPVDFIKQLNSLFMCGNLGDPIIASDCLEVFQYIRELNPSVHLSMHTNGSARKPSWWQELAKLNIRVVFGLDGLADTHHLYRIDTDFNKIIENATAFIQAGGHAEWHMLVFKHNEHQIEDCRALAKELGFVKFQVKHTTRFQGNGKQWDVLDENGKFEYAIHPTTTTQEFIVKIQESVDVKTFNISCKAKHSGGIYVSARGNVTPCCWLNVEYRPWYYPSKLQYRLRVNDAPNLHKKTLSEIFDSGYFEKIEKQWPSKLMECAKQCGNFDRSGVQFNAN
jgi:MoaA/NifB/PqqE/SkfB family radical SAM enzyme